MTLRTRLIGAFGLLSVVPLGVVTFYTYRSNVQTTRDVAAREADMLADVMTQRTQLITAQLSERIEHLVDVKAQAEQVADTSSRTSTAPASTTASSAASAGPDALSHQVADALGEAAILLNTVQVQGMRFGGSPGGRAGQSRPDANALPGRRQGGPPPPGARPMPSTREQIVIPPTAPATGTGQASQPDVPLLVPVMPGTEHLRPAPPAARSSSGRANAASSAAPPGAAANAATSAPGTATSATPQVTALPNDGIQIDLTQIRRDLYRQIVPDSAETLSAEDRQRVAREVNQRMLGIVEGIRLSAAELQKKADEARLKPGATPASMSPSPTTGSTTAPVRSGASSPAAAAAASAPVPLSRVLSAPNAPTTRTAVLTGNRLDVRLERNGQVVGDVTAEINLPNLVMTVFQSMSRQQGEVPFAVDKEGRLYAQTDEDRHRLESLGSVLKPTSPLGTAFIGDWIVVTTEGPGGSGLRFGIARPVGDSLAALRKTAARNAGFGLIVIVIALAGAVPISGRLTRNLSTLTDGVRRIARGDYAARVELAAHDEIGTLAQAFNQMAADVERHQRAAVGQERIRRELELGRQIQHDMLPQGPLRIGLTEIQGVSVPAREVGGDFFNYFVLSTGSLALIVGDVSGKGVGAALLMANLQASLRTRLALGQDLSAVADEIDRQIEGTAETLYATLFIGILDPASRRLTYVNCGHHPQFILRANGAIDRMPSTGVPVGLLPGRGYSEVSVQLSAGDRLFFYTDGCVEAENESDDMFGAARLEAALLSAGSKEPSDALSSVERAIETFRGSRDLFDDVTVMAVRVG